MRLAFALTLLTACQVADVGRTEFPLAVEPSTCADVPLAVPNDGLDDRAAIQAVLTTFKCAHLREGVYDIDTPSFVPPARRVYPMLVVEGAFLRGDGPLSTLAFRGSAGLQDWEGVRLTGLGPAIKDISFDTSALTVTSEQTHAVKVLGPATGVRISYTDFNHPIRGAEKGGDCIQLVCYNDGRPCTDVRISDNDFDHCDRSGVAVHSGTSGITIEDNRFPDTGNTSLDFEGTGDTHDVLIQNNVFSLSSGPHGVGEMQLQLVDHVRVTGNVLNGRGIDVFQSDDVELDHNTIVLSQATSVPAIWVHKDSSRVDIHHNTLSRTSTALPGNVILVAPHGTGTPDHVTVRDNSSISQATAYSTIEAVGIVSLYVRNNVFTYTFPTLGNVYGIIVNGSAGATPIRTTDVEVTDNTFSGKLRGAVGISGSYGGAGSLTTWGNSSSGPLGGIVCGNVFSGSTILGPITSARDKWPIPQCGPVGWVPVEF